MAQTARNHRCQQFLQVGGLRRGELQIFVLLVAVGSGPAGAKCADQSYTLTSLLEQVLNHVCGRGFAVCASHSDETEFCGWAIEEIIGSLS